MKAILRFRCTNNYGNSEEIEFSWSKTEGAPSEEQILEYMDNRKQCTCRNEGQNHCECNPEWDEGSVELIDVRKVD